MRFTSGPIHNVIRQFEAVISIYEIIKELAPVMTLLIMVGGIVMLDTIASIYARLALRCGALEISRVVLGLVSV